MIFIVQELPQFQSSHHSPSKPFQPKTDGFEIDFFRTVSLAGERK